MPGFSLLTFHCYLNFPGNCLYVLSRFKICNIASQHGRVTIFEVSDQSSDSRVARVAAVHTARGELVKGHALASVGVDVSQFLVVVTFKQSQRKNTDFRRQKTAPAFNFLYAINTSKISKGQSWKADEVYDYHPVAQTSPRDDTTSLTHTHKRVRKKRVVFGYLGFFKMKPGYNLSGQEQSVTLLR